MSPSRTPRRNFETSVLSSVGPGAPAEHGFNTCSTPTAMKQESRRPSLAFSSFSDESLSVSTPASILSQPMSPVVGTHAQHDAFLNDLTGNVTMKLNIATCEPLAQQHMSEGLLDIVPPCVLPIMHGLPISSNFGKDYTSYVPRELDSPIGYGVFAQSPVMTPEMHPGLRTTLFPRMYGMDVPSSMATPLESASIDLTAAPAVVSPDDFPVIGSKFLVQQSYSQQDQVVVPSQLGSQSTYATNVYTSPFVQNNDSKPQSTHLDSFVSGDTDYVHVGRDIHDETCHMGTGDVSDYMLVDHKPPATPCARPSRPMRRTARRGRKTSSATGTPSPLSSSTNNNSNSHKRPWRVHYDARLDCHVQFTGTPFTLDIDANGKVTNLSNLPIDDAHDENDDDENSDDDDNNNNNNVVKGVSGNAVIRSSKGRIVGGGSRIVSTKLNVCAECGSRFHRVEHLKRHVKSHITDPMQREYWCPLPGCGRRIGRSDNARDHIKSHLRPHAPGKRNEHCPWPEMERRIWAGYTPEKAARLTKNLDEWIRGESAKRGEIGTGGQAAVKAMRKGLHKGDW